MASIVHYRKKCIGCGLCYEMQPELWRMSRKDGKATLVRGEKKKDVYVLPYHKELHHNTAAVARACPVKVIKLM